MPPGAWLAPGVGFGPLGAASDVLVFALLAQYTQRLAHVEIISQCSN